MFVPLYDGNPLRIIRFQYVTGAIIALNAAVFLFTDLALPTDAARAMAFSLGVIPSVLTHHADLAPELEWIPAPLTLVTYMFLHAGWMHLIGNMLFLWVFGDNIEDAFGHFRFLLFFLFCGIVAALAHTWMVPGSNSPLVGASGAVAGVLAAYLVLYPHRRVWVLLFFRLPLRVPAWIALVSWILFQFLSMFVTFGEDGGESIALAAHVAGFLTGLIIALLARRRSPILAKG